MGFFSVCSLFSLSFQAFLLLPVDGSNVLFDVNERNDDVTFGGDEKVILDRNIEVIFDEVGDAEEVVDAEEIVHAEEIVEAAEIVGLLKRVLTEMDGEKKRTIRLESRLKSLEFKAEVDARETRTLKTKLDSVLKDNREMKKMLTVLLEKGGGGGGGSGGSSGNGNCSTVAKEKSVKTVKEAVDGIATAVKNVEQKVRCAWNRKWRIFRRSIRQAGKLVRHKGIG